MEGEGGKGCPRETLSKMVVEYFKGECGSYGDMLPVTIIIVSLILLSIAYSSTTLEAMGQLPDQLGALTQVLREEASPASPYDLLKIISPEAHSQIGE